MDKQPDNLAVALDALAKGLAAIPVQAGTKVPLVKWKRYQAELPSEELLREWFADTRRNIAIVTTGMVVFDVDSPEKAELVLRECGDTPYRVRTPHGLHLGYRKRRGVEVHNQVKIKGEPIDIRTNGGVAVIPNSRTEDGEYRWLGEDAGLRPVADLPVAKIGWTRERIRRAIRPLEAVDLSDDLVRRARGYLATVEGAISGQRGHDKTFRVACVLVQKFGLTFEQAWPLFLEWNNHCEPPWSERELAHKLEDALKARRR